MDGGTLGGTLLVIFVILKLVGAIHWSWLWVLSPLWIDLGLTLILFAIFGSAVFALFKHAGSRRSF